MKHSHHSAASENADYHTGMGRDKS